MLNDKKCARIFTVAWLQEFKRSRVKICANLHMGVFFLPAPKTWIRPLFLDFFENRRNYAISMVHNVFQGHLEVAEHVFDIIFMFHHVFDSV